METQTNTGLGLIKSTIERVQNQKSLFASALKKLVNSNEENLAIFIGEAKKQADNEKLSETSHLRFISSGKNPKISDCAGGPRASLAYAGKTFTAYLDSDFKNWKLDNAQPTTEEAEAEVWEMYAKDGNFNDIFNSFKTEIKNLKWDSQEQIEKFCIENKSWLRTDGYGTFFLFEEEVDKKKDFFVAGVYFDGDGRLRLSVDRLSRGNVWLASNRHRFVLPATWRLNS